MLGIGIAIRVFYYASNPIAMVTDTLEFLRKHWRGVLVAVVLGSAALYVLNLKNTIADQRIKLADAEQKLTVCEQNVATLRDSNAKLEKSISDTNQIVSKFEDANTITKQQFDTLKANAEANTRKLNQQLQTIMKDKKPQTCDEAIRYLIQGQKEYAK